MNTQFICHPDFAHLEPLNVFHKEHSDFKEPGRDKSKENSHILFRKKINIQKTGKAILKITADDYYKLYINGEFVTMGPAPSYPSCYNCNEIDVSRFLKEGDNTFAVHCYYQGLTNRVWVSNDNRQMLWLELFVDKVQVLVSNTDWLCAYHTAYSSLDTVGYDTAFLECYNSNAPEVFFMNEDFDDTSWINAAVFENADYTLVKQSTKQLDVYDISPETVSETENGMKLDFGFEAIGYIKAVANGKKGDTVIIRAAEELNPDGSLRYKMRCNCDYEEKWILSGNQDTLNQFDYKAFRYVELIYPETVKIESVGMTVRHYPYEEKFVPEVSDEKLNKIFRLCLDTAKYGTQENYVDCPTREKGQYLGDVSIAARAQAVASKDTLMMKKAIMDFCHSSFVCNGLLAVSCSSKMQEIADYSLQFPAQICWVFSIDKDLAFLKETEAFVTGVYEYFLKYVNKDGLLENVTEKWNLVDWPSNLRDNYDFPLTVPIGSGVHNVLNAFWCGFLESLDEFYSLLGKEKTGLTEKTKQKFFETFYNSKTRLFCDSPELTHSSIHSNVLPLLFDIGTEDENLKKRIVSFIAEKKLGSMGVYMAYFTLAALKKHGEIDLAIELTKDENCWLNMLKEGGTTTFEAWGKEQKSNTSLFHPWASAPLIVFAKDMRVY